MRKIPLLILLVGLAFAFFSIPLAGVDLLIDAVGFLAAFNALRALRQLQAAYGTAPWVGLFLVAAAALQLFAGGRLGFAAFALRALAEARLYRLLLRGFWADNASCGQKAPGLAACVVLPLNALITLFFVPATAFGCPPPLMAAMQVAGHTAHILLVALIAWQALLPFQQASSPK